MNEAIAVRISETADKTVQAAASSFAEIVETVLGVAVPIERVKTFSADTKTFVFATFRELSGYPDLVTESAALCAGEGFRVTKRGGSVFVLSRLPRGVYYGVHALLERNLPVIFSRGAREEAVAYKKRNSCAWKQTEFAESCPFSVRSWNLCGIGSDGKGHLDDGTAECLARNRSNATFHSLDESWRKYGLFHNGKRVDRAQVFDDVMDARPSYFMTDADGKPKKAFGGYESFPNYYDRATAEFFARRLVSGMESEDGEDTYHWTMPDNSHFCVVENGRKLHELPFTCDDGTTVYPEDENYRSTVYFNFLNRVIKAANRLRPNTRLQAFAYIYSEPAPAIAIDERIIVMVAPINTNEKYSYIDERTQSNAKIRKNIEAWTKKTKNLQIYTYWQSFQGANYSRPILRVVKENLQWFREIGVRGVTVESAIDCSQKDDLNASQRHARTFYDMNEAYIWAISKLLWNPDEDIDKLLKRYADIVYKECAAEMLEYFKLLQYGWDNKDAIVWYTTGGDIYYLQFVVGAGIAEGLNGALTRALEKAQTPSVKRKITTISEVVARETEKYKNFVREEATVARYDGDERALLSDESLDYVNNAGSAWNKAKPLTVLRYSRSMEYYPKQTKFSCRMLYDDKNIYVGYTVFEPELTEIRETDGRKRYFRSDGSEVVGVSETYIGGDILNQSVYYGYIGGFMAATRDEQGEFYRNDGEIKGVPLPEGVKTVRFARLDEDREKRYHFHVQVIPFAALGESVQTAKPYGSFSYVSDKYGCAGWMGFGLWSKQNFQKFDLETIKEEN